MNAVFPLWLWWTFDDSVSKRRMKDFFLTFNSLFIYTNIIWGSFVLFSSYLSCDTDTNSNIYIVCLTAIFCFPFLTNILKLQYFSGRFCLGPCCVCTVWLILCFISVAASPKIIIHLKFVKSRIR